jgi:polysaccharide biosynthesis/export protein
MKAGEGGPSRWPGRAAWLSLWLGLLCGCASGPPQFDRALMAQKSPPPTPALDAYAIGCPDVLDLVVSGRPQFSGRLGVGADGCIRLGDLGRLRVEGRTVPEAARLAAAALGVPPEHVRLQVAEYKSQQLYLVGQVVGLQRAVPYQGPETVLDLLQRVGGVTPGAASDDVYVVRSRLAEGQSPEVFRVNLRGIVLRKDQSTNVRLQPFDQVFVGETSESCLLKCLPPWLQPLYESLCGMRRPAA